MNCGFLVSDATLSGAAYSRLVTKLSESDILEKSFGSVALEAIAEGFIADETIVIDATNFETRDKAPIQKEEKSETTPKKRSRKSKEERDQYLKEQAEKEANLPLYEKKIEAQLDVPLDVLRAEVPQNPKWSVKTNADGKNKYWFGY